MDEIEKHILPVTELQNKPLDLRIIYSNKLTPMEDEELLFTFNPKFQSKVMRQSAIRKPISKITNITEVIHLDADE